MKRCTLFLLALLPLSAIGQTAAVNGFCNQGGTPALTQGTSSTNKLQGITPSCIVTVYFTGTGTQVPGSSIFKDSIGTVLGNPFTASANGQYLFYVSAGVGLDVVKSSGTTDTDVVPGGGGGTPGGTNGQVQYNNNGVFGGYAAVPVAFGGTGATTAYGAATNLGVPQWFTGVGAPSATCSAIANNGTFYTNTSNQIWQCSNVLGTYSWSQLGPTLNCAAASVYLNILCYGGVGDLQPGLQQYQTFSGTSGSNILTAGGFSPSAVGKWVVLNNNGNAWSPGPPFNPADAGYNGITYNAQITGYTDPSHVTLSRSFAHSTTGYVQWGTDNVPAANACRSAAQALGGGNCQILAGSYLFATIGKDQFGNSYYTKDGMAQDNGDYGQPAGGSGAVLTCAVVNGKVPSCTVAGGTNYTPNSKLPIVFSGTYGSDTTGCANNSICGGLYGYANTNSSGVPTSVTMVYTGFGYTTSTVNAVVYPLGGDGATATCTLTGDTCGAPVIGSGGAGYAASMSSGEIFAFNIAGGGCTAISGTIAYPIVGKGTYSTNSTGAINSAAWTTAPTNCSFAPTIVFNDASCWNPTLSNFSAQCTNLAPLLPAAIPIQVIMDGASWGTPDAGGLCCTYTNGLWDQVTVDTVTPGTMLTQPAMWEGKIQSMEIYGLNPGAFIDIYDPYNVNTAKLHDMTTYGGIGILSGQYDLGSLLDNIETNSIAGIVNGGQWAHRNDAAIGQGGIFDIESVSNITARPITGYGTLASNIDDWFAEEFWRPEFSGNSPDLVETCKFPQTINQRQTSPSLSGGVQPGNNLCYKGITGFGLDNMSRDNRASGSHNITTLNGKYIWRPLYYGSLGSSTLSYAACENCNQVTSDPYRAESMQEGAIEVTSAGFAQVNALGWQGSEILQPIWDFDGLVTAGIAGAPFGMGWNSINASSSANAQAVQNILVVSPILNNVGEFLEYNGSNGAEAPLSFYRYGNALSGYIKGEAYNVNAFAAYDSSNTMLEEFSGGHTNFPAPMYSTYIESGSGQNCLQINAAGLITNTGAACGGSGTFNALTGDATSTATGGATTVLGLKGVPFCTGYTPTNLQYLQYTTASSPNPCYTAATVSGSGTVTTFSSGNLSPLFTTSVATPTTTPALTFALSNAAQNSVLSGPATGGAGAPSYQTAPTISAANMTSFPTFNQNTTGTAANVTGTSNSTLITLSALSLPIGQVTGTIVPSQYKTWSCQPGLGDGTNAITAATYLQSTCKNTTGVTVTITGVQCFTDNSGSSTMNAAGNTLGALLTGAVSCTSSFAAGTQSANVALTNGDYIKFTFVADGTSKQTTWIITGTY
jgi:hypothetical protein